MDVFNAVGLWTQLSAKSHKQEADFYISRESTGGEEKKVPDDKAGKVGQ